MAVSLLWSRIAGRYQRAVSEYLGRRHAAIVLDRPYISFTFDDFPRSALHTGGSILSQFGVRGTYYVSLGLLDSMAPTGEICSLDDVNLVLAQGHELGCHTYSHRHAWDTPPSDFERAILQNRQLLAELVPGAKFESLAYPIAGPRWSTKTCAGKHFRCCRGGGQAGNAHRVDLNHLKSFFLEKSRDDFGEVQRVIDANKKACGWLIFSTHDIDAAPTPYGCTPEFFGRVVRYSVESGAAVLPVARTLDRVLLP
mgnify:CR=1 FL=1